MSYVVADSTILIALAKICKLDILEKLFKTLVIPEAVWRESAVTGKKGGEKIRNAKFIHVKKINDKTLANFLKGYIDDGESEAIVLARELNAQLIILDDRDARNIAKELGLKIIGTLAVLALAKEKGVIENVKPIIDELRHTNFYISNDIIKRFLKLLGEA